MGWFDEQIRYRKQKDDEVFSESITDIAGAILGQRLVDALDSKAVVYSAMEEVLKVFHLKMKTDEIPPEIKTVDGQLEYILRPFGIMRRSVVLEKGWYRDAVGVMLGTLKEDGSAVALIPGKFSGYSFVNIKTGKRIRLNRKTEQLLDPEALCFYKPFPLRSLSTGEMFRFMLSQLTAADIGLYIGAVAFLALVGMLSPLFTKWLFGTVLESGSLRVLISLAVFMLSYTVGRLLITAFQTLMQAKISTKADIALRAALMGRVFSLPATFFKQYAAGDLSERVATVQTFCSTILNTVSSVGLSTVFSLIYVFQIFAFAPKLVIPALLIMVLSIALTVVTSIIQTKVTKKKMQHTAKTSGMTYAMITGIQKIKLAGAEKRMFSRWAKDYSKEAALEFNPPFLLKIGVPLNLAITLFGTMIMYYIAVRSHVGVADYYAFNTAYAFVVNAFSALAMIVSIISNIKPTMEMVRPIMEAVPEISDGKKVVTQLRGSIELENVYFRYDDNMPYVINNLSLKIKPGEYVAIVGTTGCGKSTLMRLLLGFEQPLKGTIFYDRKDMAKMDLKSLRQNIGTVMQDGKLFTGDIYSNIVIASPQMTLKGAWEAAEIASIADDIRAMPMGMHTLISEGNSGGVSGGQRQRLLIARAVASKPKILMFDEATSALDNVTQRKVSEAIDSINCTRIVIAHRLSTIRHCDRIIVLDKGNIAESGTYEELIEKDGIFAALVARQRLDIEETEA